MSISQPAVSRQLAELENSLGVRLLERRPRGVALTEPGQALLKHARAIFAAESAAETELEEFKGLRRGRVAMGASTTIGNYLLPPVLGTFDARYPDIALDVDIQNTQHIQDRVLEGELDFGLTEGLVTSDQVDVVVFARDDIVLIGAPDRERRDDPSTVADLVNARVIMRETGSGTRAKVEASLAEVGMAIEPAMSLGGTEALKNAVASGLGIAFVSKLAVEGELRSGGLVEIGLDGLEIRRDLHLLTLKGSKLSVAAESFVAMLTDIHRDSLV